MRRTVLPQLAAAALFIAAPVFAQSEDAVQNYVELVGRTIHTPTLYDGAKLDESYKAAVAGAINDDQRKALLEYQAGADGCIRQAKAARTMGWPDNKESMDACTEKMATLKIAVEAARFSDN